MRKKRREVRKEGGRGVGTKLNFNEIPILKLNLDWADSYRTEQKGTDQVRLSFVTHSTFFKTQESGV